LCAMPRRRKVTQQQSSPKSDGDELIIVSGSINNPIPLASASQQKIQNLSDRDILQFKRQSGTFMMQDKRQRSGEVTFQSEFLESRLHLRQLRKT
ncbi:MAG TPA: hypothetical protein VG324_29540, partial [Blastocatellia bacterium]|nr:hypothetical protein [Blastocatellia bacterium]